MRRNGFTLIELLSAMMGATILLTGLAATVSLAHRSLEDAASRRDGESHVRMVADRIATDFRYAKGLMRTDSDLCMTLSNRDDDTAEQRVSYRLHGSELHRIQLPHAAVILGDQMSIQLTEDQAVTPARLIKPEGVRWIASTHMTTEKATSRMEMEIPTSARKGDLLVLITLGAASLIAPLEREWAHAGSCVEKDLHLAVYTRNVFDHDDSRLPIGPVTMEETHISAALLCFSGEYQEAFDKGLVRASGECESAQDMLPRRPLQADTVAAEAMNLQVLAVSGDELSGASLGLPGFVDAVRLSAKQDERDVHSMVICLRHGKSELMDALVYPSKNDFRWAQLASQWGAP